MDGSTQITILIIATLCFSFLCSVIIGYAYAQRTVRIISITGSALIVGGFLSLPLMVQLSLPAPFARALIVAGEVAIVLGVALLCGLLLSLRGFHHIARQQAKRSVSPYTCLG